MCISAELMRPRSTRPARLIGTLHDNSCPRLPLHTPCRPRGPAASEYTGGALMLATVQIFQRCTERGEKSRTVSAISTPSLKSRAILRFGRDSGTASVSTSGKQSQQTGSRGKRRAYGVQCGGMRAHSAQERGPAHRCPPTRTGPGSRPRRCRAQA